MEKTNIVILVKLYCKTQKLEFLFWEVKFLEIINAFALIINYIIIPGLTYGCQLALGALGVTIIYTVLRFSNFAHGELMSFGAMTSILITWIISYFGISIFPLPTVILALPISIIVTISYCLLIDRYCFQYHRKKKL